MMIAPIVVGALWNDKEKLAVGCALDDGILPVLRQQGYSLRIPANVTVAHRAVLRG
jgi:hypothetical protein